MAWLEKCGNPEKHKPGALGHGSCSPVPSDIPPVFPSIVPNNVSVYFHLMTLYQLQQMRIYKGAVVVYLKILLRHGSGEIKYEKPQPRHKVFQNIKTLNRFLAGINDHITSRKTSTVSSTKDLMHVGRAV
jgi:hypothetical protein